MELQFEGRFEKKIQHSAFLFWVLKPWFLFMWILCTELSYSRVYCFLKYSQQVSSFFYFPILNSLSVNYIFFIFTQLGWSVNCLLYCREELLGLKVMFSQLIIATMQLSGPICIVFLTRPLQYYSGNWRENGRIHIWTQRNKPIKIGKTVIY